MVGIFVLVAIRQFLRLRPVAIFIILRIFIGNQLLLSSYSLIRQNFELFIGLSDHIL